jgi:hypothetical protein
MAGAHVRDRFNENGNKDIGSIVGPLCITAAESNPVTSPCVPIKSFLLSQLLTDAVCSTLRAQQLRSNNQAQGWERL